MRKLSMVLAGVAILIGGCLSRIGADEATPFLARELFVSPIGWESEEEIRQATSAVAFSVAEKVIAEPSQFVLTAPISGVLADAGDAVVIANSGYRMVYPKNGKLLVRNGADVREGQEFMRVSADEDIAFVVFLRKPGAPFDARRLPGSGLKIRLKQPTRVFSVGSGLAYLSEIHPMSPEKTVEIHMANEEGDYWASYVGVGGFGVGELSQVRAGQELGVTGTGLNSGVFDFSFARTQPTDPRVISDPYVVFVEVTANEKN